MKHRPLHRHHKRALLALAAAVVSDAVFGTGFALADHVSIADGLWFATVTATTVGYGDITPKGWLPHLLAAGTMLTVIPLFAVAFSFLTSGLASADARAHLDARLAEHHQAIHDQLDRLQEPAAAQEDDGRAQ